MSSCAQRPEGEPLEVLVIPDTQVRPGVDTSHFTWLARLVLERRPDVLIHLGDHWDMPSLGSYESAASKVAHERDVLADIEAGNEAWATFNRELKAWNRQRPSRRRYRPKRWLLRGNHDGESNGGRIGRALVDQPWIRGLLEAHPLEAKGWESVPFLVPLDVAGVRYSHFFPQNSRGRVTQSRRGAPSAHAQVQRVGMSCTAGHQQGLDVSQRVGAHGRQRGVIAGSFYRHEEEYLTPQGNEHWHGVLLKHHCVEGDYDLEEVSMAQLERRYS